MIKKRGERMGKRFLKAKDIMETLDVSDGMANRIIKEMSF